MNDNVDDDDLEPKDPYELTPENMEKASQELDDVLTSSGFNRFLFLTDWFRNLLFFVGCQWIKKSNGGRWTQRNLPSWFPRAQTNKFAEKAKDLVGQLVTGQRIPITMMPATDSEEDIGMAEVAERIRDVYYTEAQVDEKEEEIASWLVLTGNAFGIPYYDMDEKHGTAFVQFQECKQCETTLKPEDLADADQENPTCPDCGGPLTPAADPDGAPMGDEYPRGAIQLDPCSPFEIRGDHRVRNIGEWQWFVRQRRYDVAWGKEKWPDFKDQIKPDNGGSDDLGQYYLDVISNITSGFGVSTGMVTSGDPSSKNPKFTAYEFYKLPCKKYPQGLKMVRLGQDNHAVPEIGPLTTMYGAGVKKGQYWLPLIHWGYEIVPGRFWRRTPLDDVVPLQLFRNTVEANIRLSVQRMGNALWLLPKGCGVDNLTGEPGQTIQYNPIAVGGTTPVKPERIPAELNNLAGLIGTLHMIDDAIEHVSGATLQGGQTPPGVTAACMCLKTKALTKRGWKFQHDILFDDELYSLNPDTGKGEWAQIKNIHLYEYTGNLYETESQSISSLSTPNHAWYVTSTSDSKIQRVESSGLKPEHSIVPIPPVENGTIVEKDCFVELMGWIVTEGSYCVRKAGTRKKDKRGDYTMRTDSICVEITQSLTKNADKCKQIDACIKANGMKFSTSIDKRNNVMRYRICGLAGKYIRDRFPDKRLSEKFIVSLTQSQLLLLCETMILGDGSQQKERNGKSHYSCEYRGYDRILVEQFQMAATLAGLQNTFSEGLPEDRNKHRSERYANIPYRVRIKRRPGYSCRSILNDTNLVHYDKQLVWCPETSTGTWIAQRDGKVYVTGNSALAYLGEKEQQSLSTLRSSYAKSWRQFDLYALELARQNWDESRMRIIAGKNRKWQVKKFTKGDLQGSVNIMIDYNGIAPKSSATTQAKIAQLTQLGMINPQEQSTRIEVLKQFGSMDLLGSIDTDIVYAAKLQDQFTQDGEMPKIRPMVDNSEILLKEAIEFAKTDEYLEMPPDKQAVWEKYCELRAYDVAQRRIYLTSGGIDPDQPATTEIPSALAEAGLVAAAKAQQELQAQAAQQGGGQPSGAQAPDPRLDAQGKPNPGSGLPGAPPSPDIGDTLNITGVPPNNQIRPDGSPRAINLPPA